MAHEKHKQCIDACYACASECEHCATACLGEDDIEMMTRCIQLDRTCADVCVLAAREMARDSEFAKHVCTLCAEICKACGDECAKHDMDHCQRCAKACHNCADECRKMAA